MEIRAEFERTLGAITSADIATDAANAVQEMARVLDLSPQLYPRVAFPGNVQQIRRNNEDLETVSVTFELDDAVDFERAADALQVACVQRGIVYVGSQYLS